jgi:hypothetical protein
MHYCVLADRRVRVRTNSNSIKSAIFFIFYTRTINIGYHDVFIQYIALVIPRKNMFHIRQQYMGSWCLL